MPTWAVVGIVIYGVIGIISIPKTTELPLFLLEMLDQAPERELTSNDEVGLAFIVIPIGIILAAIWPLTLPVSCLLDRIEDRLLKA